MVVEGAVSDALSVFEAVLEDIRRDRSLGSARLCARAADGLLVLAEALDHEGAEGVDELLRDACGRVAQSRPSMAEMIRVGNDAILALAEGDLPQMRRWAVGYLDRRHAMTDRIAAVFVDRLDAPVSIVTHSNSTVVRRMLAAATRARKLSRVWCTTSDPLGEGRDMARYLVEIGANVCLISDAAVATAVIDADMILVGADALQTLGVVNKVGTGVLALLGLQHSRPIYSASTSLKLLSPSLLRLFSNKEGDSSEILDGDAHSKLLAMSQEIGGNISVCNPYYERVEYDMFTGIYTEEGYHDPNILSDMAKTIPVAEGFGW